MLLVKRRREHAKVERKKTKSKNEEKRIIGARKRYYATGKTKHKVTSERPITELN